jgi:predicted nucleic acid-binding protein
LSAGLVDTSVVIDWRPGLLPDELAVSTITLAELATGPARAVDPAERARRQARLQVVEGLFTPIDFGRAAARSFGLVVAAVNAVGRSHRRYLADLLIAAVAHAEGLTLYTRNPDDLVGLEGLITIISV